MVLSTLRGRTSDRAGTEAPLHIGATDGEIVNCPVCSRPIVADARRCPGCGTRLLMGVPVRRASAFVAMGALAGLLVGGVVIGVAASIAQPPATVTAAGVASGASGAGAASSAPMPGASAVPLASAAPAASVAALRQAVAINGRLASGVDALRTSLAAQPFESLAVASVLRSLLADAGVGSGATTRLRPWAEADAARTALAALYDDVGTTARAGLANGLANGRAYRAAATDMIAVLGRVGAADDAARALATSVGVELPAAGAP